MTYLRTIIVLVIILLFGLLLYWPVGANYQTWNMRKGNAVEKFRDGAVICYVASGRGTGISCLVEPR